MLIASVSALLLLSGWRFSGPKGLKKKKNKGGYDKLVIKEAWKRESRTSERKGAYFELQTCFAVSALSDPPRISMLVAEDWI